MAKALLSQRKIMKISSAELKKSDWNLVRTLDQAKKNGEIIDLGSSQLIRFIVSMTGMNINEHEILMKKKEIKFLKKCEICERTSKRIRKAYSELDDMLFIKDYAAIEFESKKDFDRATSNKGFYINGKKFVRLLGTTGGVKENTVMFCAEHIHKELNRRLDNGRNVDTPLVPAKFEAYKALAASASTPVTMPKGILVIKDGTTRIKDTVIKVSEHGVEYEADKDFTDGAGMIRKELAEQWAIDLGAYKVVDGVKVAEYTPSGFNTRFPFEKGMLVVFDFEKFGREVAGSYMVEDCWGNMIDIRTVDVILTTNMLKLWNAYDSIEDYMEKTIANGYDFCVTKMCSDKLEEKRNMNYQYLQSYEDMSDEDIDELISETVNNIKGALGDDHRKAILYTAGKKITETAIDRMDSNFTKALMVDENTMNDTFVKKSIYNMIEKKMNDAKKGVIQVDGNYSIVCGDMYALCQSMFKMPITGLLKFGEYYSYTWSSKGVDEVVAFRSPMTSHNNIRRFKLKYDDEVREWFKYLRTITVLNAWDTTTDAMNGMDYDSDAIISTNNPIILKNTRDTMTIICEQRSTPKKKVTESDLKKANKNGFGDAIGTYTNRITCMFDVLATLDKGSKEYNILMDRIIMGQAYQQEVIDKIKGIEAKAMPKEWYDFKSNKIRVDKETGEILDDEETIATKELNRKLMVNKKPYFFIYNYPMLLREYSSLMNDIDNKCLITFGKSYKELEAEAETEEEIKFVEYAKNIMPVFNNRCVMNRIAHKLENIFEEIKTHVKDEGDFDYNIYKSGVKYTKAIRSEIELILKEYRRSLSNIEKVILNKGVDVESWKTTIKNNTLKNLTIACPNQEVLTDIVLDLTYGKNVNKHMAWDICGEQIIDNILKKNNYTYKYPTQCEDGDIEWNGQQFKMVEYKVEKENE